MFQNCSQVRLAPAPEVLNLASSDASLTATVCPLAEPLPPQNTKFVFVIDMSLSNIGGKNSTTGNFSAALGSDRDGDRFKLVKDFMTSCAGASANQYAVVAFSNGAGRVTSVNGKLSFVCDGTFSNSAQAVSDVDQLISLQNQDKTFWQRYDGQPYYGGYEGIMGNTSYSQALNCVRNIVVNDLSDPVESGSAQSYEVIFLSDGQPKDATAGDVRFETLYDVGCESKGFPAGSSRLTDCYINGIVEPVSYTMQAALGYNKNMRYHAIYYQPPGSTTPTVQALIEKFMGEIARTGGTNEATILGLLKDELNNGRNPLCEITQIQSALEFRPEVLTLVNLSVKRVNGVLEADSDMDGLSDNEEIELGSNPANARSQVPGVLDGICIRVGGFNACQTMRNAITCSTTANKFGVADCDLKILKIDKLYSHPDQGVDSDKDGMPDIIEILRGTDPGLRDMSADPDGDGRTNKQEILENTDPMKFDKLLYSAERPEYSVKYVNKQQAQVCSYGAWQLHATTLPGLDTVFFNAGQPVTWSHAAGENVYMVFYRQDSLNSASENVQFYGALVHATYVRQSNPIGVFLDRSVILPVDFEKMGEVIP